MQKLCHNHGAEAKVFKFSCNRRAGPVSYSVGGYALIYEGGFVMRHVHTRRLRMAILIVAICVLFIHIPFWAWGAETALTGLRV